MNGKLKHNLLLFALLALLGCSGTVQAQKTFIALDTTSILLGDQIGLRYGIELPEGATATFPVLGDTLTAQIEIIKKSPVDTSNANGILKFSQLLTVTAFDSGYFVIPPLSLSYNLKGDTATYWAETEAMLLEGRKVPINEQEDIKALKDIFDAPLTFREMLPWILAALGLLALMYLAFFFWRKYRRKEPLLFVRKPDIPPHTEALSALEALRKKKLWENGFIKEYYTELTDIVRNYISRAFGINAPEFTTDETVSALAQSPVSQSDAATLKEVLVLSDLVKFAKYIPVLNDHESSFSKCNTFVNNTVTVMTWQQKEEVLAVPVEKNSPVEDSNDTEPQQENKIN